MMQTDDGDDEVGDRYFSRSDCDGVSHSRPKVSPDKHHTPSSQEHVRADIAAIGTSTVHLQTYENCRQTTDQGNHLCSLHDD